VVAQARRGVQPHGGLLRLEQGRLAQRAHRATQRRAFINRALALARDRGIVVGAGGGGGNGTSFESQRHGQSQHQGGGGVDGVAVRTRSDGVKQPRWRQGRCDAVRDGSAPRR